MDAMQEFAVALARLHKRSPMAALTTTRWVVTCLPLAARGVALVLAAAVAAPMRHAVIHNEGIATFALLDHDGAAINVDKANAGMAAVARMVVACANGDEAGAEAIWDGFSAVATRWQRTEALHALACLAGGGQHK